MICRGIVLLAFGAWLLAGVTASAEDLCLAPGEEGLVGVSCAQFSVAPVGWEGFTTEGLPCSDWPIEPGTEAGPYCAPLPDCPLYEFGWTISASDTDPRKTVAAIGGQRTLYLWLVCVACGGAQHGLSAAVFDLEGSATVVSFTPVNGFLNAGTDTEILMAVGACPVGPVVAAEIVVDLPLVSVDAARWGQVKASYRRRSAP
jgi:hypothetical protein